MSRPTDLEPAVRDPKKLRRTAWLLVAIMIIGGILILKAYEKVAIEKSKDTRPSVVHRIAKERDLRIFRQDAKTVDLFDLRGSVWAVHLISLAHPEASQRSFEVMKRLAAAHASTSDFHLVSLIVDPIQPQDAAATLAKASADLGISLPQWWLGTNEAPTLHKFVKNELKTGIFPHLENGRWIFDTSIVLIDRGGHIRRAVIPQKKGGPPFVATFDFDQAASWDEKHVKTGTNLSNQAQLEALLADTVKTLLAEPPELR